MTRSVHDNLLVSYEVDCEARTISLRTEKGLAGNPIEKTYARFAGVEGYRFMNDALGNIISGLEELSLEKFFSDYGCEIAEQDSCYEY